MSEPMDPQLEEGEVEIVEDEDLWRQIHPSWIDVNGVCKTAFMPGAKDEGKLSLARSTKVAAEENYLEYVESLGLLSAGVLATRVSEIMAVNLRVVDDGNSVTPPDPCPMGHCYADFRGVGSSRRKRMASTLRDQALQRGWIHQSSVEK